MFFNNIDPVMFRVFGLEIRYYGLVYAIGFLSIYFYLLYVAKRDELQNLKVNDVETFMIGLVISLIVGARIFHVFFYDLGFYFSNPVEIIKIWKGGLSFHGGLTFSISWLWYFCRKRRIEILRLTDILVIPVTLFLALGRMANFANGELVGKVTNISIGVKFKDYEGFRHPTQIYESLKNFTLLLILVAVNFAKGKFVRRYIPGLMTAFFLIGYGVLRFFIEFLKEGTQIIFGLNTGQILSIFTVIFGIYLYKILSKTAKEVADFTKRNKKKLKGKKHK